MKREFSGSGPHRRGFAALFCLGLALAAGPARGDAIVADLSSHLIAITGGFTGASVVLFGATDGPGDIVVVVKGPEREMTVWRKGKVAGIWVNAESMTFTNVPSFYAVAASRPLDEAVLPDTAALYRIGAANLKLESKPSATTGERRSVSSSSRCTASPTSVAARPPSPGRTARCSRSPATRST